MKLSLGKFGPKHCDLPTMFANIAILLRVVTINIDKHYTKRKRLVSYVLLIVAAACYSYVYIFSMFWFVFIRCRQTGDMTAASVVFSLGTNSETCATKLVFMIFNKEAVQSLVQKSLECYAKILPGTRFYDNLQERLLKIKKRVMMVWLFFVLTGASYVSMALLLPGRHFPADLYVVYGLEPMFESPNYEVAFFTESISILVGTYSLASITAFIIIIIGYIEAQMIVLSIEVQNVWDDALKYYDEIKGMIFNKRDLDHGKRKTEVVNAYIANRLREFIVFHISGMNLLNDFERKFRLTMAVEFLLLITAIVAELLGGIENTFIELPYTFIQIFVFCLIGQRLIDASNVFKNAVYDCKWENFDVTNRRTVLLILQNSQRPLTLTAGGLKVLDFVCLMSAIKSTYSFYTTLQSTVR